MCKGEGLEGESVGVGTLEIKLLEQPLLPLCSGKQLQPHPFTSHSNSRTSVLDKANCLEEEGSQSLAELPVLARAQVWRRGSDLGERSLWRSQVDKWKVGAKGTGSLWQEPA